jgi:hypothetical protein
MTPEQYLTADPALHSPSDLVDSITTQLTLMGMKGGYSHQLISQWLLISASNNEEAAYELARQIVRLLRSKDSSPLILDLEDCIERKLPITLPLKE